ncbi:MAG TPA: BTAD domain-containing putative transcriptional regulator [Jiangellales bacterium]|nr:BTAD domain-containing putative transcriptional regulator [Jiangellales bacterium]
MRFRVLGSIDLVGDSGEVVPVLGRRRRTLLAVLLVSAGEPVPGSRLLEAVWSGRPPAGAANALQARVSDLRRLLGDERDLLVCEAAGYRLAVDPGHLDVGVVVDLAARGRACLRAGDPVTARQLLGEALELWRGRPLAELADEPFAVAAVQHWTGIHTAAVRDRWEADLALDRAPDVLAEVEALVAAEPLDERLRGLQMRALYGAGRQADALAVYSEVRRVLDRELGVTPGPELRELFETLLRQEGRAPARTPPRQVRPPPVSRLSVPASSFVGRDTEVDTVLGLMAGTRLLTLTGPGGVGKTRLALEAARRAVDGPAAAVGDAVLVELAPVSRPEDVASTMAAALRVGTSAMSGLGGPRSDPIAVLLAALSGRDLLLVLDNAEHVVDAAADLVQRVLSAAPAVRLLVTSREQLGLPEETVWSVPSLRLPVPDVASLAEVGRSDAGRLFLDRAGAGAGLDDRHAAAVATICRALDGIPLALELAASRARSLGVELLTDRLAERLDLLAAPRLPAARQRTLRAVVDWSWDLLDDDERRVLRRLSVFPAAFRAAEVEPVTTPLPDGCAVLDVLARLVEKSLVQREDDGPVTAYSLLETLRAYGRERLREAGEDDEVRDRHLALVERLVEREVPRLRTAGQLAAAALLRGRLDDVRAALTWCAVGSRRGRGLTLAGGLGWFWYLLGHRREGRRWLGELLGGPAAPGADEHAAAWAEVWLAFLDLDEEPPAAVAPRLARVVPLVDRAGVPEQRLVAHAVASLVAELLGAREEADEHRRRAHEAAAVKGDPADLAMMAFLDARSAGARGEPEAGALLEGALDAHVRVGDRWGQVQCLGAISGLAELSGDVASARQAVDRALPLTEELDLPDLRAVLHVRAATLALAAGDLARAEEELAPARRIAREQQVHHLTALVADAAGLLAREQGRLEDAEREHAGALQAFLSVEGHAAAATTLGHLAELAERRGATDRASELLARSVRMAERSGDAPTLASARATLDRLRGPLA